MGLADLIHRKKTATILSPATAIPAIPAIPAPFQADTPPRIAGIATIALAEDKQTEIAKPSSTGKAQRQPDTVSAFCESYGGHCSVKVTGVYPDDCIKTSCDYHKAGHPSPGATA